MIDVLIPTYRRADRLAALVANIHDTTTVPHRVVIISENDDLETDVTAIRCLRAGDMQVINRRTANYQGGINTGIEDTDGEWIFTGADDLLFHDGWDLALMKHVDDWFAVYGTQDLNNPFVAAGTHSTHSLVARWYIDEIGGVIDQPPGVLLNESLTHNFCDTEMVWTAKARARFRPCLDSVVEHVHCWSNKPGRHAPDETHRRSVEHIEADSALYDSRRHLWQDLSR